MDTPTAAQAQGNDNKVQELLALQRRAMEHVQQQNHVNQQQQTSHQQQQHSQHHLHAYQQHQQHNYYHQQLQQPPMQFPPNPNLQHQHHQYHHQQQQAYSHMSSAMAQPVGNHAGHHQGAFVAGGQQHQQHQLQNLQRQHGVIAQSFQPVRANALSGTFPGVVSPSSYHSHQQPPVHVQHQSFGGVNDVPLGAGRGTSTSSTAGNVTTMASTDNSTASSSWASVVKGGRVGTKNDPSHEQIRMSVDNNGAASSSHQGGVSFTLPPMLKPPGGGRLFPVASDGGNKATSRSSKASGANSQPLGGGTGHMASVGGTTPRASGPNSEPLGQKRAGARGPDGGGGGYPPALGQFVTRSFAYCKSDVDRRAMREKLDEVIAAARGDGTLWTHDWAEEPIPTLPLGRISLEGGGMLAHRLGGTMDDDLAWGKGGKGGGKKKKGKKDKVGGKKRSHHSLFDGEHDTPEEMARKQQRAARFSKPVQGRNIKQASSKTISAMRGEAFSAPFSWDRSQVAAVKGTSTALEKAYLRLTSAPDPTTVRPLLVLKEALTRLKAKYSRSPNWPYTSEQLKSIRQDLTVQHIFNDFTVAVYEYHSRLSLANGDLSEFNQCQTQLLQLYDKLGGCINEFAAYRILYHAYTDNASDANHLFGELGAEMLVDPAVKHACDVHASIATSNFVAFFRLYRSCPNHGRFIMAKMADRVRHVGLRCVCQALHPLVPISYLNTVLGFETRSECLEYLDELGVIYADATKAAIKAKSTYAKLTA